MKQIKFTTSLGRVISALLLLPVLLAPDLTAKGWADQKTATGFEPPPGRDAPRNGTAGGGSRPVRTSCLSNSSATGDAITALSPGKHLGLTQVERPTFMVYLSSTTAQTAEFSLFDEQMNGVYQVNVPVPNQAGLVSIPLANTAPPLAKEQRYYWSVALICNPNDRTEDVVVGGWIERTEAKENLKQQLATMTALERVSLYAEQGFWYDAVNLLLELQRAEPNNAALVSTWEELIKSVGLDAIATKPIN